MGASQSQPCGAEKEPLPPSVAPSAPRNRAARKRAERVARIEVCEPICAECGKLAALVKGSRIYPHRPDLQGKNFYLCPCGAYVGCHPYTRLALGTPAGPSTRVARNRAHNCFDILWHRKMVQTGCGKGIARNAAYDWLADQLGYPRGRCHIAWMNGLECAAVVRLCDPFVHRRAAIADTTEQSDQTREDQ